MNAGLFIERILMQTTIRLIAALVLTLMSVTVSAAHYSDLYVIPVVGHARGANGAVFMTDLSIQNFQSTPITVQLIFIQSGEGDADNVSPLVSTAVPSGSVTVPANGSVLLRDILAGFEGLDSVIGSLIVGSDRPFAVTSRAYTMNADGSTIGQSVPASANFLNVNEGALDPATSVAYVPGLIQNDRYRTNLGAVIANATGFNSTLNVTVTLRNAAGTSIGTKQIVVGPGQFTHVQFSARELSQQNFDIGSAEFRITQGSGSVVPYASVIDNRTTDAVFIEGNFPDNSLTCMAGKGAFSFSPFRMLLGR